MFMQNQILKLVSACKERFFGFSLYYISHG